MRLFTAADYRLIADYDADTVLQVLGRRVCVAMCEQAKDVPELARPARRVLKALHAQGVCP